MISRGDLTDDEWALLKPLLPVSNNRCGRWRNHRQVINGIIHRLSTGTQWRALPERFGPWQTVHKRHLRWSADGTWEKLLQHLQAVADARGDIDWDINVDSTSIRAHHHAVGAPKRASEKNDAADEALGPSRGGLTTKLHLSADGKCRPLSLTITAGQRADCTQFRSVLDRI